VKTIYGGADWPTSAVTFSFAENSPAAVNYRLYVAETAYVTGGASEVFTVSGALQQPVVSVKYSAKSQTIGGKQVKLTIRAQDIYAGKAVVYDGKKKLGSAKIDRATGTATYKLPKTLKAGTHKIKVVYEPAAEYVGIYAKWTSAVTKVKVVKAKNG